MCIYIYYYILINLFIYFIYVTDRNKEGKAEGKRFNQMVAKWLNRSALEHSVDAAMLGCQGEGCGMIMVHAS